MLCGVFVRVSYSSVALLTGTHRAFFFHSKLRYVRNACPLCCDRENGFVDYQRFVGCVVPSSGCPSPVSRCSQVPTGVSVSDLRWSIILALSGDFVRGSLSSVALLTCTNWRFCDGHAKFCSNHMNRILMPIQKVILVHGCS